MAGGKACGQTRVESPAPKAARRKAFRAAPRSPSPSPTHSINSDGEQVPRGRNPWSGFDASGCKVSRSRSRSRSRSPVAATAAEAAAAATAKNMWDTVDLGAHSGHVVRHGALAGKTYGDIVTEEPDFCKALLSLGFEEDPGRLVSAAADDPAAFETRTLGFFKEHASKTYYDVFIKMPGFCSWVRGLPDKTAEAVVAFSSWLDKTTHTAPDGGGKDLAAALKTAALIGTAVKDMSSEQVAEAIEDLKQLRTRIVSAECDSLAFGKHRGKSYEHVYSTEPGYCSWVTEAARAPSVAKGKGGASLKMLAFSSWLMSTRPADGPA